MRTFSIICLLLFIFPIHAQENTSTDSKSFLKEYKIENLYGSDYADSMNVFSTAQVKEGGLIKMKLYHTQVNPKDNSFKTKN